MVVFLRYSKTSKKKKFAILICPWMLEVNGRKQNGGEYIPVYSIGFSKSENIYMYHNIEKFHSKTQF